MYSGALWVWIVCYQMVMTAPHNVMQLHQNPTTIAYATGAVAVCRYIALVTDCTVYIIWFIFVKLSIIHTTKFQLKWCCVMSPLHTVLLQFVLLILVCFIKIFNKSGRIVKQISVFYIHGEKVSVFIMSLSEWGKITNFNITSKPDGRNVTWPAAWPTVLLSQFLNTKSHSTLPLYHSLYTNCSLWYEHKLVEQSVPICMKLVQGIYYY